MAEIMPIVVNGGMGIWQLHEPDAPIPEGEDLEIEPSTSTGLSYGLSWTPEIGIVNGNNLGIRHDPDSVDYPGRSGLTIQ
jgi:hypothetical protein